MPTHAVTRREGSGLRPRTGLRNRGEEERKRTWGTPPQRCPPGTAADPGFAQRQPGRTKARSRARGPRWPEQPRNTGTDPHRAACTAADPAPSRSYLAGGVSRTGRPPRGGGVAEASLRAQRAQAAASSAAAVQLRHPDPAGDFHLLPGARGIAQRKWPGRTAARFPLSPLSLTAREEESGARRPRKPGSPPSGPCGALPRPSTRAGGVGRAATAISARGEGHRGPRGLGRFETPPSCPSSPSPPLLMDEPRELALACASLWAENVGAVGRERKLGERPGMG